MTVDTAADTGAADTGAAGIGVAGIVVAEDSAGTVGDVGDAVQSGAGRTAEAEAGIH